MLEIIVIQLLLACGSGVKMFFRFFYYMHRNNVSGDDAFNRSIKDPL